MKAVSFKDYDHVIHKIIVGFRRWKNVQATVRELNQLHDRELNDLGIGRGKIREIAQQSVK